jgi:hypothetical protein
MSRPEPTPKRVRKSRTNYQKVVESATAYCSAAINVCESFKSESEAITPEINAQIRAYMRVLQILKGEA